MNKKLISRWLFCHARLLSFALHNCTHMLCACSVFMLACSALALRTRMKISLSLALACSGSALALVAALRARSKISSLFDLSGLRVLACSSRSPLGWLALRPRTKNYFLACSGLHLLCSCARLLFLLPWFLLMPSFSFSDEPIIRYLSSPFLFLHLDGLLLS